MKFSEIKIFAQTPTLSVFRQLPFRYAYQQRAMDDVAELQQTALHDLASHLLSCAKKDVLALKLLMTKPFPGDDRSLVDFLVEWSCDFKNQKFFSTEFTVFEDMFVNQSGMSIPEIVAGIQAFKESTNDTFFVDFQRKNMRVKKELKSYLSFILYNRDNVG